MPIVVVNTILAPLPESKFYLPKTLGPNFQFILLIPAEDIRAKIISEGSRNFLAK